MQWQSDCYWSKTMSMVGTIFLTMTCYVPDLIVVEVDIQDGESAGAHFEKSIIQALEDFAEGPESYNVGDIPFVSQYGSVSCDWSLVTINMP